MRMVKNLYERFIGWLCQLPDLFWAMLSSPGPEGWIPYDIKDFVQDGSIEMSSINHFSNITQLVSMFSFWKYVYMQGA